MLLYKSVFFVSLGDAFCNSRSLFLSPPIRTDPVLNQAVASRMRILLLLLTVFITKGRARTGNSLGFNITSEQIKTLNEIQTPIHRTDRIQDSGPHSAVKNLFEDIHIIKGLLDVLHSLLVAGPVVSDNYLSKLNKTKLFIDLKLEEMKNNLKLIEPEAMKKMTEPPGSDPAYAMFTITGFECPDCTDGSWHTITSLQGTPTNSPMMEFTWTGLTVKQDGFYLISPELPIDPSGRPLDHIKIFVPDGPIELTCVSTVWLNQGQEITFKTTARDREFVAGTGLRIQKI